MDSATKRLLSVEPPKTGSRDLWVPNGKDSFSQYLKNDDVVSSQTQDVSWLVPEVAMTAQSKQLHQQPVNMFKPLPDQQ